ncbi:MAG: WD40/YVTN/BNR-like repeat-containing protein [Cyclobacteriaceae bacterium]
MAKSYLYPMKQSYVIALFSCILLVSCQPAPQENQQVSVDERTNFDFTWTEFNTPATASLRGLSAVSEEIAWASGSGATCLRTTDGGKNWQSYSFDVPDTLQFRDVEAFGEDTAYLLSAGTPGLIYQTTDGGQNWVKQYENTSPDIFLDGMAFWDEQRGVVMGDPLEGRFVILKTTDDGQHWERIASENIPLPREGEGGFAASGTNIVVKGTQHAWFASGGKTSRVFRSVDGGKNWTDHEVPIIQGESSQGIFSLAFADTLRGVAVGGDFLAPYDTTQIAAYTTDGGRSWQLAVQMPGGYRSGAAYFQEDQLFIATGTNGTDYSTDFGKTWLPLDTAGYHSIQPVPGQSAAWLSGNEGKVAKLRW